MAVDLNLSGAFIDGSSSPSYSNVRILGVRLRKFCLWHRLLLNTIQSPFVTGKPIQLIDIRRAVGICRLRFGNSDIKKPILVPFLIYAGVFLISILHKAKEGKENPLQQALRKRAVAFRDYCGDYLQNPEYQIIPQDTKNPRIPRARAPDEIEQFADILAWTHWPEWYIWELPIGRANWYRTLARRDTGLDVDFVDEKEREFTSQLPDKFRRPK